MQLFTQPPHKLWLYLIALCWPTVSFAQSERCEEIAATLESVAGKVEFQVSPTSEWQLATLGQTFCFGDKIHIIEQRAALRLANDTLVRLNENSTLVLIAPNKSFWVELIEGAAHFLSRTPEKFEVKAPYLNAAVDGTEFIVTATEQHHQIDVIEGTVRASQNQEELTLTNGESAVFYPNNASVIKQRINLTQSAAWVIHYPLLLSAEDLNPQLRKAIEAGDYLNAYEQLTSDHLEYKAALALSLGKNQEANRAIEQVIAQKGEQAALPLIAIKALSENQSEQIAAITQKLANISNPDTNTLMALALMHQSQGELTKALDTIRKAHALTPNDIAVTTRYIELLQSNDYTRKAKKLVKAALERFPYYSRLHSLSGFIALSRRDNEEATKNFSDARKLDSNDGMAVFGLGLTSVAKRDIESGRKWIELAVLLDPSNSLYRSYLGKTYHELDQFDWASTQYDLAKELDPNDPTPWLYSAHLLRDEGKSHGSIVSLQESKERNDNRAVYRSRFNLDKDQTIQNGNVASAYLDLNYDEYARSLAGESATNNYADYASISALNYTYRKSTNNRQLQKNTGTKRRILAPIQTTESAVSLSQPSLITYEWLSPGTLGANEYTSAFKPSPINGYAAMFSGSQNSQGREWQMEARNDYLRLNTGEYQFASDGFDTNNDFDLKYDEINLHIEPLTDFKLTGHRSQLENEFGDIENTPNSESYDANLRNQHDAESYNIGIYYTLNNRHSFIGLHEQNSVSEKRETTFSPFPSLVIPSFLQGKTEETTNEFQWNYTASIIQALAGYRNVNLESNQTSQEESSLPFEIQSLERQEPIKISRSYVQISAVISNKWHSTVGYETVKSDVLNIEDKNNYRAAINWKPLHSLSSTLSYFSERSGYLGRTSTLKPTTIYGITTSSDSSHLAKSKMTSLNVYWSNKSVMASFNSSTGKILETDEFQSNGELPIDSNEANILAGIKIVEHIDLSLNIDFIKQQMPRDLVGTFSDRPTEIHTINATPSMTANLNEKLTIAIEWKETKQVSTWINRETIAKEELLYSINKSKGGQLNASLHYKPVKNSLSFYLSLYNITNNSISLEKPRLTRDYESPFYTSLRPQQRSINLQAKINF